MSGNPYFVGTLLLAGVVGWMSLLRGYQLRCSPNPECLRKLVHVTGGLLAVPLPLLFSEPRPLFFTLCAFVLVLIAARNLRNLKQGIGAVLGSVTRRSNGELWFPVSVALLFLLARGDLLLYSIPLLILTFADAAAAVVGTRYGEVRYSIMRSTKTMEGSMTFFVVALLAAGIPLVWRSAEMDAKPILVATVLALALSLAEGACGDGLDNLVVPVAGFFLLRWLLILSTGQLLSTLGAASGLTAGCLHGLMRGGVALPAAEASRSAK
jgi:phytol kinase